MEHWEHFDQKYGAPIGKGAQCRVYRQGDLAVKVLSQGHKLSDMMREAYALSVVEELGLPTTALHGTAVEQGHLVMTMGFAKGRELLNEIIACTERGDTEAVGRHLRVMADFQLKMHRWQSAGLMEARRVYRAHIQASPLYGAEEKRRLLNMLNALPDGDSLCHNDYHPRNILFDGENYTIIDWDSASLGDPAGDLAHTYVITLLSSKELAEAYLALYLEKSGMDKKRLKPWISFHALFSYCILNAAPQSAQVAEALLPLMN